MARIFRTCKSCGESTSQSFTSCQKCGSDASSMTIKITMRKFLFVVLFLAVLLFLAINSVSFYKNWKEPPIHFFDISYDSSKFSELKAIDDFTKNNWFYKFSGDMSNGSVAAQNISTNIVNLKEPYGSSKLEITLVKNKRNDVEVLFQLIGQFNCNSSESNCELSVRFDRNKRETYRYTIARNGRDDLIYLIEKDKFLADLKKSKSMSIIVEIFNNGFAEYNFNVNNLSF